jgi:hypothetical protein
VRAERLRLAHHTCELRLPGCELHATTVHLHPGLHGDHRRATVSLCLAACHQCHGRLDGGRAHGKPAAATPTPRQAPAALPGLATAENAAHERTHAPR